MGRIRPKNENRKTTVVDTLMSRPCPICHQILPDSYYDEDATDTCNWYHTTPKRIVLRIPEQAAIDISELQSIPKTTKSIEQDKQQPASSETYKIGLSQGLCQDSWRPLAKITHPFPECKQAHPASNMTLKPKTRR